MVNTVLDSISKTLHSRFGDDYYYYVEGVEQKVKTPCFTMRVNNPSCRSVNHKDYYRTMPCIIHFFSDNKVDTVKDCGRVGEDILDCLEYLKIGDRLVRAENMRYQMVGDVLQVFLTYHFWTEKIGEIVPMEDLESVESSAI